MKRHLHSAKVVLFEHNFYTVRWTAVLRSGEAWPKACGVPCSIKFSLNHFLWTLYVNTAFLRCVVSGYCDERAGIKIYCTVLLKYWTVWFKSYSILKMSGIDGSFILYNNVLYCIVLYCIVLYCKNTLLLLGNILSVWWSRIWEKHATITWD